MYAIRNLQSKETNMPKHFLRRRYKHINFWQQSFSPT